MHTDKSSIAAVISLISQSLRNSSIWFTFLFRLLKPRNKWMNLKEDSFKVRSLSQSVSILEVIDIILIDKLYENAWLQVVSFQFLEQRALAKILLQSSFNPVSWTVIE